MKNRITNSIYITTTLLTAVIIFYIVVNITNPKQSFYFYFFNPLTEKLEKEQKKINIYRRDNLETKIKKVIDSHLIGPISAELRNLAPKNCEVTKIYLAKDKTLYIDFESEYLKNITAETEKPFLYSLYNTLYKNFKTSIDRVVITIGGRQFSKVKGNYYYSPEGFPFEIKKK